MDLLALTGSIPGLSTTLSGAAHVPMSRQGCACAWTRSRLLTRIALRHLPPVQSRLRSPPLSRDRPPRARWRPGSRVRRSRSPTHSRPMPPYRQRDLNSWRSRSLAARCSASHLGAFAERSVRRHEVPSPQARATCGLHGRTSGLRAVQANLVGVASRPCLRVLRNAWQGCPPPERDQPSSSRPSHSS